MAEKMPLEPPYWCKLMAATDGGLSKEAKEIAPAAAVNFVSLLNDIYNNSV